MDAEHSRAALAAKLLLLHQCLAQRHIHTPFTLALDEDRVEGAPDVVGDPDLVDGDPAGVWIAVQLDDAGGVTVSRTRADARSLERTSKLRRAVTTAGQHCAVLGFCQLNR